MGDETPPERKKLRTKWLEPNADRARRSNKNERRLARQLGGRRIPRSGGRLWSPRMRGETGAGVTEGGDIKTKDFHLENKRTEKQSISLKRDWLDKVRQASRQVGKDPGVILTFEQGRKDPEDWVLVPIDVFERLRANKDR